MESWDRLVFNSLEKKEKKTKTNQTKKAGRRTEIQMRKKKLEGESLSASF